MLNLKLMKAKECTLIINTCSGYIISEVKCKSIREAVREAKEGFGFAYRIFVGNKVVKSGYCF